jgi:hypothetical protein
MMRKLRFSIANLLVLILVLGVGFAALRESSELWESSLFTLALFGLLISILLAIHRHESRRAFWLGFAVFGSIYLGCSLIPPIEGRIVTTKLLTYLDSKVPGRAPQVFTIQLTGSIPPAPGNQIQNLAFSLNAAQLATSNQGQVRIWNVATGKIFAGWGGTTENFVRIGHTLFALLLGWLGGQLSRRLCQRTPHPETVPAVALPSGTAA